MERDFKGIWVPKEVWLDKELSWIEKFLLVEIDSLDNEEGCWASNEYFSKFFGVSKDRISKLISGLKRKGYLTVQLVYKEGTKTIDKRIVRITHRYRRKCLEGVGGNADTRIGESADTPIGENTEDNNTSINNTVNNTLNNTTKETVLSLIDKFSDQNQELKEALLGFKEMREKKKAPLTVRAMKMAITSLEKLSLDYKEQVEIIDQSTMNSWNGFYALKKEKTGKNSQEEYFEFLDQWAMEGEN